MGIFETSFPASTTAFAFEADTFVAAAALGILGTQVAFSDATSTLGHDAFDVLVGARTALGIHETPITFCDAWSALSQDAAPVAALRTPETPIIGSNAMSAFAQNAFIAAAIITPEAYCVSLETLLATSPDTSVIAAAMGILEANIIVMGAIFALANSAKRFGANVVTTTMFRNHVA